MSQSKYKSKQSVHASKSSQSRPESLSIYEKLNPEEFPGIDLEDENQLQKVIERLHQIAREVYAEVTGKKLPADDDDPDEKNRFDKEMSENGISLTGEGLSFSSPPGDIDVILECISKFTERSQGPDAAKRFSEMFENLKSEILQSFDKNLHVLAKASGGTLTVFSPDQNSRTIYNKGEKQTIDTQPVVIPDSSPLVQPSSSPRIK